MELYRLRSMDQLFRKYQELENQSIYFANPAELNDPMEGFRDIVWQGDSIVWTNLFRHYLYCLNMTYLLATIVGDTEKIEPGQIPVSGGMVHPPTPDALRLFDDICDRVFERGSLHGFIANLADTKRKVRYDELLLYLLSLHYTALPEVRNAHIGHGLAPDRQQWEPSSPSVFRHTPSIADLAQRIEDEGPLNFLLSMTSRWTSSAASLTGKLTVKSDPEGSSEQNRQLLFFDFPGVYVRQLGQILYPNWYVACFMNDYRNSSTWGHYGDHHRGACLIFGAEVAQGRPSLPLNQSGQCTRVDFHEVEYRDKAGEIDFFRSIGRLPAHIVRNVWYTDQSGNLSECSSHLGPNDELDAWRHSYWTNFYRDIAIKSSDWEYEQESRLILYGLLDDLQEPGQRTLTYNFSSLKGVIFGIGTSDDDKVRIIRTILRKCEENKRSDFEFYQAYYSHETGDIRKDQLPLEFPLRPS